MCLSSLFSFVHRVSTLNTETWEEELRAEIFDVQDVRFKINLSYGFLIRNNESGTVSTIY